MPAPTNVILPAPYIIIERSTSPNISISGINKVIGIISMIYPDAFFAVGQKVFFDSEGADKFSQGEDEYFIIKESCIKLIDTLVITT